MEKVFEIQITQVSIRGFAIRLRINPCPRSLLRSLQRFEGSDAVAEITGFDVAIDPAHRYTEPSIQTRTIDFSPIREILPSLSYSYNINFKPKTFLRLKRIEAVYRYRQLMQKELSKNIRTKTLSRKPRDIF